MRSFPANPSLAFRFPSPASLPPGLDRPAMEPESGRRKVCARENAGSGRSREGPAGAPVWPGIPRAGRGGGGDRMRAPCHFARPQTVTAGPSLLILPACPPPAPPRPAGDRRREGPEANPDNCKERAAVPRNPRPLRRDAPGYTGFCLKGKYCCSRQRIPKRPH